MEMKERADIGDCKTGGYLYPDSDGVDSWSHLNAAMAAGILMYEASRTKKRVRICFVYGQKNLKYNRMLREYDDL